MLLMPEVRVVEFRVVVQEHEKDTCNVAEAKGHVDF